MSFSSLVKNILAIAVFLDQMRLGYFLMRHTLSKNSVTIATLVLTTNLSSSYSTSK